MNRLVHQIATMFAVIGVMTAGSAFAQEAITSAAAQPATAAAAPRNDPIVQKRMEVREANQQQRARTSEARQAFRAEAREARNERNDAARESRARATEALQTSQSGQAAHRVNP
jgi:hypothetical protein